MIEQIIQHAITRGSKVREAMLRACTPDIVRASQAIQTCLREGNKLLFFGNGGSAADAQHLATEFVCRLAKDRAALPAIALTTDTSALTAISNDYGFAQVFARQLAALGRRGDIAVGISTSGNSENVNLAIQTARSLGITTIALTGRDGGELARLADISIVVPAKETAFIQECHIAIGHILCALGESIVLGDDFSALGWDGTPQASAGKIVARDTLLQLRAQWRDEHKLVVWTNGVFDILHVGHVRSLQAARALGDVLVVGINRDETVRRAKGTMRPYVPELERAEMVAALECVDAVLLFDEPTPTEILAELQPNIHCKGADYAPPHGKPIPELSIVQAYGGRVEFLPMVTEHSTTDLIERIQHSGNGHGQH